MALVPNAPASTVVTNAGGHIPVPLQELRREDGLDAAARVVRGAFTAHMAYADADGHCTDM